MGSFHRQFSCLCLRGCPPCSPWCLYCDLANELVNWWYYCCCRDIFIQPTTKRVGVAHAFGSTMDIPCMSKCSRKRPKLINDRPHYWCSSFSHPNHLGGLYGKARETKPFDQSNALGPRQSLVPKTNLL